MCGKIPHANKSAAKRFANYGDRMHVYFCRECKAFHCGHSDKTATDYKRAKVRYKDWKRAILHDEYE